MKKIKHRKDSETLSLSKRKHQDLKTWGWGAEKGRKKLELCQNHQRKELPQRLRELRKRGGQPSHMTWGGSHIEKLGEEKITHPGKKECPKDWGGNQSRKNLKSKTIQGRTV